MLYFYFYFYFKFILQQGFNYISEILDHIKNNVLMNLNPWAEGSWLLEMLLVFSGETT